MFDTPASFFDASEHLWIEITKKVLPPHLMVEHTGLFMIEHDDPGRVFLNLTSYICMVTDARAR
jgi:hypothetical protein